MCRLPRNCGSLNLVDSSGPVQACIGVAFAFIIMLLLLLLLVVVVVVVVVAAATAAAIVVVLQYMYSYFSYHNTLLILCGESKDLLSSPLYREGRCDVS